MHFPKNEIGAPFLGISCLLLSALAPVALAQVEDVQLDQGLTDERGASLAPCTLFADGFETGNTAGWDLTEP